MTLFNSGVFPENLEKSKIYSAVLAYAAIIFLTSNPHLVFSSIALYSLHSIQGKTRYPQHFK